MEKEPQLVEIQKAGFTLCNGVSLLHAMVISTLFNSNIIKRFNYAWCQIEFLRAFSATESGMLSSSELVTFI